MRQVYSLVFRVENLRGLYPSLSQCPEIGDLRAKFREALLKARDGDELRGRGWSR